MKQLKHVFIVIQLRQGRDRLVAEVVIGVIEHLLQSRIVDGAADKGLNDFKSQLRIG